MYRNGPFKAQTETDRGRETDTETKTAGVGEEMWGAAGCVPDTKYQLSILLTVCTVQRLHGPVWSTGSNTVDHC